MAVRNVEAIARKAEQLAQEKKELNDSRIKYYQLLLDAITSHQQEAIDACDTKKELERLKIPSKFVHGTRLEFRWREGGYSIGVSGDSGMIEYFPEKNMFRVWRGGSGTNFADAEDLGISNIHSYFEYPGEAFKKETEECRQMLIDLSQGILPFLHAFFNYVDNL